MKNIVSLAKLDTRRIKGFAREPFAK